MTTSSRVPNPAYPAKDSTVLYGDKEVYARLGKIAEGEGGKELVEEFEIPIRSAKAWVVKKGACCLQGPKSSPDVSGIPNKGMWTCLLLLL